MRLLIVANSTPDFVGRDLIVKAVSNNENVDSEIIYSLTEKDGNNFRTRLLRKICWEIDNANANEQLLEKLKDQHFDCVFIVKGNKIKTTTLRKIKSLYPSVVIAGSSGDNMLRWTNKSIQFHRGQKYYDVFFSVNIPSYKGLRRHMESRVFFFDKAFDAELHKPVQENKKYEHDIVFVGSYEKDRYKKMNFLAQQGLIINAYGAGWPSRLKNKSKNFLIHRFPLVGDEYTQAICSSKIVLGFLRKSNSDTQTSRSFEIPACGAFMLMERSDDHVRLFKEGSEAEFFGDEFELLEKCRYYLADSNARDRIKRNGRRRSLDSDYSFKALADRMLIGINEKVLEKVKIHSDLK